MTELRFTVEGTPRAWARARKGRGRGHFFTDDKTKSFERRVALAAEIAMRESNKYGLPMLRGGVWLHIDAYWPALKRAKHTHRIPKTTKPDWDNIGKMCDGLNGVAWLDDGQVADGRVAKWFAPAGEAPRSEFTIRSLDGEWP